MMFYLLSLINGHPVNISEQLFAEVRLCQEQHGRLTEELLSALYFVFGQPILHALDLVDRRSITRLTSPSGRIIHQVVGSSGQTYTCLKASSFCTCPSYTYTVLVKMETIMCKHLLAVNLAEAIHNIKEKEVSNETITAHLSYDC
ncbi:zinc finger SWIM domain-containing protein 7-like [Actinia tenebrosa]|uniref:Zinc finger SWIM domain-containing protein 7-like n=1 Tax=Actinia tenebrosa TaxID=6105 RepID=A0A6P8HVL1_ACTTE|nr:zinc finger SWIM domain-containing protein 7-like [Actinia tenebrosa]